MKRMIVRTMAAVLLAAAVGVGVQSAPAGADPAYTHLEINTLSPQYDVNGCLFRTRYGNFGSTAYAQMRIYNPASCDPASVLLSYHDGTQQDDVSTSFSSGYTTGTDGCGAYREIQVNAPVVAYAVFVLTSVPSDPDDPSWFNGWRIFSADGEGTLPVNSYC